MLPTMAGAGDDGDNDNDDDDAPRPAPPVSPSIDDDDGDPDSGALADGLVEAPRLAPTLVLADTPPAPKMPLNELDRRNSYKRAEALPFPVSPPKRHKDEPCAHMAAPLTATGPTPVVRT